MLFVTNRVLNEGPTPLTPGSGDVSSEQRSPAEVSRFAVPRSVTFDLADNQAEQSVYFCRRNGVEDYVEIGNGEFFEALKTSSAQQILLYIHGFSNLPEPHIFPQAILLQSLFDQLLPNHVEVVPLIWPCDSDFGIINDYFDDQLAADASAYAFARLFEKFMYWRESNSTLEDPCTKWINVLAHSMGNRVLRGALDLSVRYYRQQGMPLIFRNVFMVAADVVNGTLESGEPGFHITEASRNVVVYFAADDLAMRASKVANMRAASRRLGHTGPRDLQRVATNVFSFDCGNFNNQYDPPLGHAYFGRDRDGSPGLLIDHLCQCVLTGRVPVGDRQDRQQILNTRFWAEP